MRMKAAVLAGVNQPFVIEELELDPPGAGEALIQMAATGVCHSDLHVVSGDLSRPFPVVLGHEGAGIVQEIGEGVTAVKPGDHVILTYLPACGKCRWCHTGQPTLCDLGALLRTGKMLDGTSRLHRPDGTEISNFLFVSTWAEYSVAPEASLVAIPDYVPLERVCLFGCGFTTGFGAVTNSVHMRPGETATIVGCGGLGLAAVQGARMSGAGKIIAVDVHPEKLAMARKFGATHTVLNAHAPDEVIREIMDITWGLGTDFSFEFVGFDQANETIDIAFRAVRKGGTLCLVGVGSAAYKELPIDPYTLALWSKKVQGVLFGDAQFQWDIPKYVRLFEDGRIDLDGIVTHELRLEEINTAVENILAGNRVARQVIRFD
ncbi:MAG: Zn-dependent alcohol dehydrogenase [SAR324 cluster bacterium]|nr:Zn-dependent alcohol dehydrogenase [SAR324 cluster bacterium]